MANPDDLPELAAKIPDRAKVFDGDRFVRRGRRGLKLDAPKETTTIWLVQGVLAHLRMSGPGWPSRVNQMLRPDLALNTA